MPQVSRSSVFAHGTVTARRKRSTEWMRRSRWARNARWPIISSTIQGTAAPSTIKLPNCIWYYEAAMITGSFAFRFSWCFLSLFVLCWLHTGKIQKWCLPSLPSIRTIPADVLMYRIWQWLYLPITSVAHTVSNRHSHLETVNTKVLENRFVAIVENRVNFGWSLDVTRCFFGNKMLLKCQLP